MPHHWNWSLSQRKIVGKKRTVSGEPTQQNSQNVSNKIAATHPFLRAKHPTKYLKPLRNFCRSSHMVNLVFSGWTRWSMVSSQAAAKPGLSPFYTQERSLRASHQFLNWSSPALEHQLCCYFGLDVNARQLCKPQVATAGTKGTLFLNKGEFCPASASCCLQLCPDPTEY